jgi:phosphatidylserine decarboxylase
LSIPLTRYAKREILLYGGAALAATVAVFLLAGRWWPAGFLPAAVTLWVLWFFRDPPRRVPQGEGLILAPADGRVTHVETVPMPEELGGQGQALRVSIFLSIFNCHLNRAPVAAAVERVIYRPGRYLNAMKSASARENEQNLLVLQGESPARRVLLRQISGAIARRIVCEAAPGDRLDAGQKFGMIKFGSRTDLVIPLAAGPQARVAVGDHVKAGLTVLGHFE